MENIIFNILGGVKPYKVELIGVPPTPSYLITWKINQDAPFEYTLNNIDPGEYQIKVTDSKGCIEISTGTITLTTTTSLD